MDYDEILDRIEKCEHKIAEEKHAISYEEYHDKNVPAAESLDYMDLQDYDDDEVIEL